MDYIDDRIEITFENTKNEYEKSIKFMINVPLEYDIHDHIKNDIIVIETHNMNTEILKKELKCEIYDLYRTNKIFDNERDDKLNSLNNINNYLFKFHSVVKTLYFQKYKHVKYIDFYDYFYNQTIMISKIF